MKEKDKNTTQIISKGKKVYCVTSAPYPPETLREIKKAGFKVKVIENDNTHI